jgi:CheY-like chemotaxis protein
MVDATPAPLILVVDDERDVRDLIREVLNSAGFRTVQATDGAQVLALARQHRPDLIILDVMMRGMDGYTALTRLRGDSVMRDVPVIVVTAQEAPVFRTLSEGVGATLHVTKPFSGEALLMMVRRVLAERPPA